MTSNVSPDGGAGFDVDPCEPGGDGEDIDAVYVIRIHPTGGYAAVEVDICDPDAAIAGPLHTAFAGLQDAQSWASAQGGQVQVFVHDECHRPAHETLSVRISEVLVWFTLFEQRNYYDTLRVVDAMCSTAVGVGITIEGDPAADWV